MTIRKILLMSLLVVIAQLNSAAAMPPESEGRLLGEAVLSGLQALREGKWHDAVESFNTAIAANRFNKKLYLERGVALALDRQFEAATADLVRSEGREAELWNYAVEKMSGNVSRAHGMQIPRSLQGQYGTTAGDVSIPGHLIQGGRDYTTAYASYVFYEMASTFREAGPVKGGALHPDVAAAMVQAGRWFANRAMADPDLAWLQVRRAEALASGNHLREALEYLTFAESTYPADPDIHFHLGGVWLALGRAATARAEYTRALTERTDFAEAYFGRAQACNRLGDARRAESDLEAAKAYGLKPMKLKIASSIRETIQVLRKQLEDDAAKNRPAEVLQVDAAKVIRAAARNGILYNETYQDTLRRLEDAVRAEPGKTAPYVACARYLIDEADNRMATVVPAEGAVPFRKQVSREWELRKAVNFADRALAIQKSDVPATVAKAMALQKLGQSNDAEQLIRPLMQPGQKHDPEALRLYAEFLFKRAGEQQMAAAMLRTPRYVSSTNDEWRSDGLWEVTTTTRYDPSPANLQQAGNLELQATRNLASSRESLQEAVSATRGTMIGYFLASDYELWFGDRNKALPLLMEGVKKYPREIAAYDHMAGLLHFLLRKEDALLTESAGLQLVQTSAAPLLGLAWSAIADKSYEKAEGWLADGLAIDPSDARLYTYHGVIEDIAGDTIKAARYFHMALALSEARLAMDEPDNITGTSLPRNAAEFALSMGLRNKLAAYAMAENASAEAMDYYNANAALAVRFSPGGLAQSMFGAMFPDPNRPAIPAPQPDNGAAMIATADLQLGRLYQTRGNMEEAAKRFQAAASLGVMPGRMIPNVGTGGGDTNFSQFAGAPAAEAQMNLAKLLLNEGRNQEAFQLLQSATQNNPPSTVRKELNTMLNSTVHALNEDLGKRKSEEAAAQQRGMDQRLMAVQQKAVESERLHRSGAPVDPDLVGTWQDQSMTLTIVEDGTYRQTTSQGAAEGRIQAWNSRITLMPENGAPQQAFYRLTGSNYYQTQFEKNILQLSLMDGRSYRLEKK